MNILLKVLNVIVPILIIYRAFTISLLLGFLSIIAAIAYWLYVGRVSLFVALSNTQFEQGKIPEARMFMKKAADMKSADADVKIRYGYLLLRDGKVDEAEKVFHSLKLDRTLSKDQSIQVQVNISHVLWKQNKIDEAIVLLEEQYAKYKNSNIYGTLGYLLTLNGDIDRALKFNLEAYEYNDTDHVIIYNLAYSHFLHRNIESARELFEKLCEQSPRFPHAYFHYGQVLKELKEPELALEQFEEALKKKFTFTSTITPEEVQNEIDELKGSQDHS